MSMIYIIPLAFLISFAVSAKISLFSSEVKLKRGDTLWANGTTSFETLEKNSTVRVYLSFELNELNYTHRIQIANGLDGVTADGRKTFGDQISFTFNGYNFDLVIPNVQFSNIWINLHFVLEFYYNYSLTPSAPSMQTSFFIKDYPAFNLIANASNFYIGDSVAVVGTFYVPYTYYFQSINCYNLDSFASLSRANISNAEVTEYGRSVFKSRISANISGSSYKLVISNLQLSDTIKINCEFLCNSSISSMLDLVVKERPTNTNSTKFNSDEIHSSKVPIVVMFIFVTFYLGLPF
ncbi:uncharacterized protein LOC136080461 isoform X2 [Hydra vulgaris]|uniref:Uncharacterized protein LOC136080461 isoform X2 n=1 Tax=Hydra vulgaris TaxID=6087 RepID=A0ABM4BVG1_HYDVU